MRFYCLEVLITCCLLWGECIAQESEAAVLTQIPSGYFNKIAGKAGALSQKISATANSALDRFVKQQEKIKRRLSKTDSLKANAAFAVTEQRYKKLKEQLNNPGGQAPYIPLLDTLNTSLKFLEQKKDLITGSNLQTGMDGAVIKLNGLQDQLRQAESIKQFLTEQKQYLTQQLQQMGVSRQLMKMDKDVYSFSQQVKGYKEMLAQPEKIERKVIDLLAGTKLFGDFMRKNSLLSGMFSIPGNDPADPAYLQNFTGLQTRDQVNQLIQDRISNSGPNALQQVQANVQQAQDQLAQLKDRVAQYGNRASDEDMPDFRPNTQRTKTFLKRLEYGMNMQSQRPGGFLPVTSDIGVSAGYRINDQSVLGIGAGFKMGWGEDIRHMQISQQGVSLRSYISVKLKKSLWISGGYEMNYLNAFNKLEELRRYNAWQQSGLIGICKKVPVNTRLFKNTQLLLLWDFMSYWQVPRSQPLLFRIGYGL